MDTTRTCKPVGLQQLGRVDADRHFGTGTDQDDVRAGRVTREDVSAPVQPFGPLGRALQYRD